MATYSVLDGSIAGHPKPHATAPATSGMYVRRAIFDASLQNIANDGSGVQLITVPEKTLVLAVFFRVITADAGGGTLKLGSGLDDDQWGATLALTAAANNAGSEYAAEYFASADTIDIIEDGAASITTLKCEVVALMVPCSDTVDANSPEVSGSGD